MRTVFALSVAIALVATMPSVAQHQHSGGVSSGDSRQFVPFPPQLVEHTLANMRDHLLALQQIQEQLAQGHADQAARIAESRLGMSSLSLHGAQEVAKYMPEGMQDAGTAMHLAASRFVIAAQNADVNGDIKPAISALAEVIAQCNGCHAGYRIR